MRFTKEQNRILANYLNDVAKGFFLASFPAQAFFTETEFFARIIVVLFHVSVSLLFLYLALLCAKEIKTYAK